MMSRVCSVLCLLLSLVIYTASLDLSQIQVYPKNGGIAKVFVVQLKNQAYKFNATTAIDVCTRMGVSIATHAQVETAHRNGLETCRYGWVMEKIAVIPRSKENPNCGKNKTGVIVWSALPSQLFDAFCFNSTGQTEATSTDSNMTTVSPGRTDAKTTSSSFIKSTHLNKNFIGSSLSPQPISTAFNTSVLPTTFPFTVAPMTTKSFQTSPLSSSVPSAGYQPSISSSLFTSITYTDLSSYPFSNSSSVTIFHNETDDQPPSGKGFSFGAVPIACVFLVVMLLVMAGTGTFWYFKIKQQHRLSPWERIRHKDMFETEMWRHTEDFNMQNDNRNCSDDVTLQMEDEISS